MTNLSVNINKVALLRNSRGRDFPKVGGFAEKCLNAGARGITLHPRPDQRHARYSDVSELKALCDRHEAELNVEGYPSDDFLKVVTSAGAAQCTLVPDAPGQLTSDHGWEIEENGEFLGPIVTRLRDRGIRTSLFVDHRCVDFSAARALGVDRVELYTEPYASAHRTPQGRIVLEEFRAATAAAQRAGLGVNAGHDLSLDNLADFLSIESVLEVSIGHALIVESLDLGIAEVIRRYVEIIGATSQSRSTRTAETSSM